jgi:hypothetical protein
VIFGFSPVRKIKYILSEKKKKKGRHIIPKLMGHNESWLEENS